MKNILLIFCLLPCIETYSQILTLNNLAYFTKNSREMVAELLTSKGFALTHTFNQIPSYTQVVQQQIFEYQNRSTDSINNTQIEVNLYISNNRPFHIEVFFGEKFDAQFRILENQLKKIKKIKFYFDDSYSKYITVYEFNNCILSVARGILASVKTGFQCGSIFIDNKSN
jgi:hypothetical protein